MKLTRKRLLVASVAAVVVIGGAWFTLPEPGQPPYGVTRSAYRAIRLGMTISDVQQRIIGIPSDGPESMVLGEISERDDTLISDDGNWFEVWDGNEGYIVVHANREGIVWAKHFLPAPYQPSFWDRVLSHLQDFRGKLGS